MSQDSKKQSYLYTVGRRKTATARVRFYQNTEQVDGHVIVNGKEVTDYFPEQPAHAVLAPIKLVAQQLGGHFSVKVTGGGLQSQAEAVRHGISRLLVQLNEDLKQVLKAKGYMRRDPRMKERKKPGLRRARRAPQWSKR